MFRTISRLIFPNPFEFKLKRLKKREKGKVLLCWNRGLGDIALGLYAMVHRIREVCPETEVFFLTRSDLEDGFSLLENVHIWIDPEMRRGASFSLKKRLKALNIDRSQFDLIIAYPNPTEWVSWQRGSLVPKLKWDLAHESRWKKFSLSKEYTYVGVQAVVETNYGAWRNWPKERWDELFHKLEAFSDVKVILFGGDEKTEFRHANLIDLRGKTTLFELLSIIKNCCSSLLLPDSGILSMAYYLDASFPIYVLSLWADPNHGILKQNVPSPNPFLKHSPLIGDLKNLQTVTADQVLDQMFPLKPLDRCVHEKEIEVFEKPLVGVVILAGGQGSRLGYHLPKGCFPVLGKSLFERLIEKIPEESPIAIMTSYENHEKTLEFFQEHAFFKRDILFFQQEDAPFKDLDKKDHPYLRAPSGNGSFFRSFERVNGVEVFQQKGVRFLSLVNVDNPLVDPVDPKLFCFAMKEKKDAVLQCIREKQKDEKMGALVSRGKRIYVLEYLHQKEKEEYSYFYTGMMALSLEFCKKMAAISLPKHFVLKEHSEAKIKGYKEESFIFDALGFGSASALCYDRSQVFFPLKDRGSLENLEVVISKSLSVSKL